MRQLEPWALLARNNGRGRVSGKKETVIGSVNRQDVIQKGTILIVKVRIELDGDHRCDRRTIRCAGRRIGCPLRQLRTIKTIRGIVAVEGQVADKQSRSALYHFAEHDGVAGSIFDTSVTATRSNGVSERDRITNDSHLSLSL